MPLRLVSLRFPTDKHVHPIHREIAAPVTYLPEYLHQEPLRVLRGWWRARRLPGYRRAKAIWLRDLRRDITPNRVRRFGQACVLAAEIAGGAHGNVRRLHAHFLHTPASVAFYCSLITRIPWSCSAHAKDIWTTPDWEKREKLASLDWLVTCTASGHRHLQELADCGTAGNKVALVYHGLDFGRFPAPGTDPRPDHQPLCILSVGRAVPKKGYPDLLQALSQLPPDIDWRFRHIGGGPELHSFGVAHFGPLAEDFNRSFERWLLYFSPYFRIGEFCLGVLTAHLFMQLQRRRPGQLEALIGQIGIVVALATIAAIHWILYSNPSPPWYLGVFRLNFGLAIPIAALIFLSSRYREA